MTESIRLTDIGVDLVGYAFRRAGSMVRAAFCSRLDHQGLFFHHVYTCFGSTIRRPALGMPLTAIKRKSGSPIQTWVQAEYGPVPG